MDALKRLMRIYELKNEDGFNVKEVLELQRLYYAVFYERSSLFPENPSNDWDANEYGSMQTCDGCLRGACTTLNRWYKEQLRNK